ncbi:Uncharacterised protein [Mycobacterium tuberculosis]|uniref:Uncharacterized protein n=2 Tax=Mycobacterium tuberculosis TaxID=1773 RepID=A0A654ZY26_MYCTX|nr:Uncharacterised protein [Mycobacterium tuberculosis]
MHAFDAGRIHKNLVPGTRQRKFVDQLGIEFQRQYITAAGRTLACHKVIGAQRGLNQRREGAQDPVGVQAHQRVDVRGDSGSGRLGIAIARRPRRHRNEKRFEQIDQRPNGSRVLVEHRFNVGLAVREARLAQVLRVGTEQHDLLPSQPGTHHQLVESVDFDPAVPDRGHRLGESVRGRGPLGNRRGQRDRGMRRDLELIDPDRQTVRPGDGERSLFEHHDSHALQHRQQLAQRSGAPTEEPGQLGDTLLVAFGKHQLDRIVGQLRDDRNVANGIGRGDGLFVGLGEGGSVMHSVGLSDGASRRRRADQTVGPGSRGFGQQTLDPDPVGFGNVHRRGGRPFSCHTHFG